MYPLLLAVLLGLVPEGAVTRSVSPGDQFGGYWYQGKAELTRYELDQARYGEMHKGEAMLTVDTGPFLPDKAGTLEEWHPAMRITLLNLNSVRNFFTGLYPDSL